MTESTVEPKTVRTGFFPRLLAQNLNCYRKDCLSLSVNSERATPEKLEISDLTTSRDSRPIDKHSLLTFDKSQGVGRSSALKGESNRRYSVQAQNGAQSPRQGRAIRWKDKITQ